jgi:CRP-like cAMP-binding protein
MPNIFTEKKLEPLRERRRRSEQLDLLTAKERLFSPTLNSDGRCTSPLSPLKHRRWSEKRRHTKSPVERYRRVAKAVLNHKVVNNDAIKDIPMFKDCDHLFMDQLSKDCGVEAYQENEVIIREGDQGDKLYLLKRGTVQVEVGGKVVTELIDGSIFGEMALLKKNATRTATIRAMSFCDCRVLHKACFQRLLKLFPLEKDFFEREAQRRQAELEAMREAAKCKLPKLGPPKEPRRKSMPDLDTANPILPGSSTPSSVGDRKTPRRKSMPAFTDADTTSGEFEIELQKAERMRDRAQGQRGILLPVLPPGSSQSTQCGSACASAHSSQS